MKYRILGKTGLRVSELGLGASQLGRPEVDERQVERLLRGALDLGINFIDTAAMYKLSEERIGRHLAAFGDRVIIATKCGDYSVPDGTGFRTVKDYSPQGILETIDRSRKKLRRDILDIVQFHGLPAHPDERRAAIEALFEARQRGWVRFVGVSIDSPPPRDELWPSDTQEFTYNLLQQESEQQLMPSLADGKTGIIVKQPIANAVYLMAEKPEGAYYLPTWERAQKMDVLALAGDEPLVAFALRFVLSHPQVHTAIVGTTRLENLAVNAQACDRGALQAEAVTKVREAFQSAFGRSDPNSH